MLFARTDALAATLLTSDVDERDAGFVNGERTAEGFFRVESGLDSAIARALAYAPYADVLWCETSTPDLDEAEAFAAAVHERVPGQAPRLQLLAVLQLEAPPGRRRRSPSSRRASPTMGYRFQFITLAGFHALNAGMFELARRLRGRGHDRLRARSRSASSSWRRTGYTATRHQREVGAGYFDLVAQAVSGGESSTLALKGSTEEAQFEQTHA